MPIYSQDPNILLGSGLLSNKLADIEDTQRAIDQERPLIPSANTMGKLVDSAFRLDNSVGSFIATASFSQFEEVEGYNPFDDGAQAIQGYEDYADAFINSTSPEETTFIKQRIAQQMNDRQFLSESGAAGVVASLSMGVIDPVNVAAMFVPAGAVVRGGGAAMTAAKFAGANAVGGVLSEAALHATQETRTFDESLMNVAVDALVGGILGGSAQLVVNRGLRETVNDNVKAHLTGNESPRSIGAAEVATTTLDQEQLAGVGLLNKTLSVTPAGRLAMSPSHTARVLNQQLAENNFTFAKNSEGIASFSAVETSVKRYKILNVRQIEASKDAYKEYRKTTPGKKMSLGEFNEEIGRAMRRGDTSSIPEVEKAAKEIRPLFESTKQQMIDLGILKEDVKVTTAASYLPRVYKFDKILSDRTEFRGIIADWLQGVSLSQAEKATPRLAKVNAGLEAAEAAGPRVQLLTNEIAEAEKWSGKKALLLDGIDKRNRLVAEQSTIEAKLSELSGKQNLSKSAEKQLATLQREIEKIGKAKSELEALNRHLDILDNPKKFRSELKRITRLAGSIGRLDARRTKLLKASEGLSKEEAAIHADEIINKIIGAPSGLVPRDILPEGLTKRAGFTKKRTLNIPDEKIENFLESDINFISEQYVREIAPEIELTRAFGRKDMGEQLAQLSAEYDDLIRGASSSKDIAALEKQRMADIRDVEAMRDRLIGTYGAPQDPRAWYISAGRTMRNASFLRLLGGMTISAVPDMARPIMEHGLMKSLKPLAVMLKDINAYRIARNDLKEMAVGLDYALSSRTKILADINDPYSRRSYVDRFLNWGTQKFGNWTFMNQWNDFWKGYSGIITQSRILDNANRLTTGKAVSKSDVKKLAQMGIDQDMLLRIGDQFKKHGEDAGGLLTGHSDLWDDAVVRSTFQNAMMKNIDSTVITPGIGDTPLFMSKEGGKLIMQFKSFIFAQHNRAIVSGVQMGEASFYYGALMSVSLGALTYVLKQKLAGRDIDLSPNNLVKEGLDRSGMLGWLSEPINTLENVSGGRFGLGSMFGAPPVSRFQSRNAIGAMLGPTFDLGGDMALVANGVLNGEFDDKHTHAIRKMMPFQNLFYLAPLLNQVEEKLK